MFVPMLDTIFRLNKVYYYYYYLEKSQCCSSLSLLQLFGFPRNWIFQFNGFRQLFPSSSFFMICHDVIIEIKTLFNREKVARCGTNIKIVHSDYIIYIVL